MDYELKSVLISDDVDQQCIDLLSSNGIQVVKNTKLTKDQLKVEIAVIRTWKSTIIALMVKGQGQMLRTSNIRAFNKQPISHNGS